MLAIYKARTPALLVSYLLIAAFVCLLRLGRQGRIPLVLDFSLTILGFFAQPVTALL